MCIYVLLEYVKAVGEENASVAGLYKWKEKHWTE